MQRKIKNTKKSGFTLIELSISIVFISVLLLGIMTTASRMASSYRRGISLKKINSVGRDLMDEFSSTIASSPVLEPESLCKKYFDEGSPDYSNCISDGAHKLFYQEYEYGGNPVFGVLCTGTYSYLWNTGIALDGRASPFTNVAFRYMSPLTGSEMTITNYRLLKVPDSNRYVCLAPLIKANKTFGSGYTDEDISKISGDEGSEYPYILDISKNPFRITQNYMINSEPINVISTSSLAGGLALYDTSFFPTTVDTASHTAFYLGSFTLATLNSTITISAGTKMCEAPLGVSLDSDYCALNKFNFATKTVGE